MRRSKGGTSSGGSYCCGVSRWVGGARGQSCGAGRPDPRTLLAVMVIRRACSDAHAPLQAKQSAALFSSTAVGPRRTCSRSLPSGLVPSQQRTYQGLPRAWPEQTLSVTHK